MAGLQPLTRPRCSECKRVLTDPASIARGYGPECAAKVAAKAAWPFDTPVEFREGGTWKHGHVVAYQARKPTAPLRIWCGTDARNFRLEDVRRIEVAS